MNSQESNRTPQVFLSAGAVEFGRARKRTRETLQGIQARYHALFEFVPDGIVSVTPAGLILAANASVCTMLGYTRAELIGRHVAGMVARKEIHYFRRALEVINSKFPYRREWRMRRKGNSFFAADVMATLQPDGNLLGIVRDITESNRTAMELRSAEEQLRALVARLHNVREEEARRIARELHDDLGQQLTALSMEVANLDMGTLELAPSQREGLARMQVGVEHMIAVVQQISGGLRLAQLDVLGLGAAIEWQAKEFSRRCAVRCRVTRLDEAPALSDDQSTALFRILQEALTNIMRHAAATEVEISLVVEADQTALQVRDNGRGITAAEAKDPTSIGRIGMRERAQLSGGTVTIFGESGAGTTVVVRIWPNRVGARLP